MQVTPSPSHGVTLPFWRKAALTLLRTEVLWSAQALKLTQQPSILISNHDSLLDGVLVALASPIPLVFAVTPTYAVHNRYTRAGLAALARAGLGRVTPLSSNHPIAMRSLARALQSGESVMIFPSGAISKTTHKRGYEWLHEKTKAPILRASIVGANRSRLFAQHGDRIWPKITLTI